MNQKSQITNHQSPMRCDVVGVGANSIDFVYRLPAYPRPDSAFAKLPITGHLISCGGQITTALATCAAMGLSTSYIGTIGTDAHGRRMREELQRRGIDLSHAITRDTGNPFAVILLDDREGERVVLWHRDPLVALSASEIDRDAIVSGRLVHVDDVDLDASIEAARLARAAGVPVTSDIERTTEDVKTLLGAVTIPIFAEHVPSALTGETELPRALERLRQPHHTMLCVTLGARGALLLAAGEIIQEPGIAVKTVDTTGAGDVLVGVLAAALDTGIDLLAATVWAIRAASLKVTRPGTIAGFPTAAEVAADQNLDVRRAADLAIQQISSDEKTAPDTSGPKSGQVNPRVVIQLRPR
jgi:sugar/nucleoside kinase (ribokinase family)